MSEVAPFDVAIANPYGQERPKVGKAELQAGRFVLYFQVPDDAAEGLLYLKVADEADVNYLQITVNANAQW